MNPITKFQTNITALVFILLITVSLVSNTATSVLARYEPLLDDLSKDDVPLSTMESSQLNTPEVFPLIELHPVWTTGMIRTHNKSTNFIIADLNQDNQNEILSCIPSNVFKLNYLDSNYDTTWFSELTGCAKIAIGDRERDGTQELFVVSDYGNVTIFSGITLEKIGEFSVLTTYEVTDIEFADVDNDNGDEIIVLNKYNMYVYDAITLELEWQADGMGGKQVEIGDIDGDAFPEIVINNNPAYILDAGTKMQEWAYSGGFGDSFDIGDIDNDEIEEIVYITSSALNVFEGDSKLLKWSQDDLGTLKVMIVSDVNMDGQMDIVVGNNANNIVGVSSISGEILWSIASSLQKIGEIGVGDTNNDGINEIVWATGVTFLEKTGFSIGNWETQSVDWVSDDLQGPFFVASGDIDDDGQVEILTVGANGTGFTGGSISVYDGSSYKLKWSIKISSSLSEVELFEVGQLDNDTALEMVVGMANDYLLVYDGINKSLQWAKTDLDVSFSGIVQIRNIDSDPVNEIIVGLDGGRIKIFDVSSNDLQWDYQYLASYIRDFSVGDLDGNGVPEIAILMRDKILVLEAGTWQEKLNMDFSFGEKLIIREKDTEKGELLVVENENFSSKKLNAYDGETYSLLWQRSLGNSEEIGIDFLSLNDIDLDGNQEVFISGNQKISDHYEPLFWIASPEYPFFWLYNGDFKNWGRINSFDIADTDNDNQNEILFGMDTSFQLNEISFNPVNVYRAYLPKVSKPAPSKGIFGKVTYNGQPMYYATVTLRMYRGDTWGGLAYTHTDKDGNYAFKNMPGLHEGEAYGVWFENSHNSDYLSLWSTPLIKSYETASEEDMGVFDIANISLTTPVSGANVALPYSFQWNVRPNSPIDSYQFNLFDPNDGYPDVFTSPLGYVNSFTMTSLPPEFYVDRYWTYPNKKDT